MRYRISLILGLSILASSSLAYAAPKPPVARDGEVIDSIGGGAIEPIINEAQTENGIGYLTGGVGDEELAFIKSQELNYNVRLLAKAKSGEYMGDMTFIITDVKGGEVLNVSDAGPYFYVNLPVGKYSVEAISMKGVHRKVKVYAAAKPPASSTGNVHIVFNE